ncbi:HlyD family efflux transporter periplasmic adaptor subunit [bacterium]|nr:HlyD family efflux transporter periplasmic adaptor subunit [bacterium]
MLNISDNSISSNVDTTLYKSYKTLRERSTRSVMVRVLLVMAVSSLTILLLPWTQNIRSKGAVTTLRPEQRPQTIESVIAGRIEKWYVKEGDYVKKGDTILFISEIKDNYFDPELLDRTDKQKVAKQRSAESYSEKAKALDRQILALEQTRSLKLQQAKNKVRQAELMVGSDSMELTAAQLNLQVAQKRYDRMKKLYEDGLKSLTDLESREMTLQQASAEKIAKENRLLASRNELINSKVELMAIVNDYRDKISKAEADKYTAISSMYSTEADVTKLENMYKNYSVRTGMYYITAPQEGYVTKAIQVGLGETIKEGAEIVSIMPSDYELAVQMYVKPIDLPLIQKGQHVRIQFDGWPSIVFSGWPNTSFGTFGGEVLAYDNFISPNGMYRVIVIPDEIDHPWPEALRVGAGTSNIVLLKDVPFWYEIWRKINGFPPNYYKDIDAK